MKLGQRKEALQLFTVALGRKPHDAIALMNRAEVFSLVHNYNAALLDIERLRALKLTHGTQNVADTAEMMLIRAKCYYGLKMYAQAEAILRASLKVVLKKYPNVENETGLGSMLVTLALTLEALGKGQEAYVLYTRASQLEKINAKDKNICVHRIQFSNNLRKAQQQLLETQRTRARPLVVPNNTLSL